MTRHRAGDPDEGVELLWRHEAAGSRPGLTLHRIVRAAVEVADADGLEGLSMRKVADWLGFTSMSLYRHVPGRDHLIDLMCDAVMSLPDTPPTGATEADAPTGPGWRARLESCARESWELRKRHPWLAEVRGTRRVPGPHSVARYERMLSAAAGTGLPPAQVVSVVNLVGRFIDAEALRLVEVAREERLSGVTEDEWWAARDSLYARLDCYPTLTRLWQAGGYDDPEDPFEFGLRCLLDGVEALVRRYRGEVRDETRDERCQVCGNQVEHSGTGRPRRYCSRACQQSAYRQRRSDHGRRPD
ncbi:TetR/AcrR family transcriptional regulator [Micromonospora sp. KC606]|uniref:TetR/AcrR family transcriptional regulator n=1 Tax=Micromonospora sp. KC606 TaxID=2530379 RepID=UPI001044882E|nr:TetR/AcrR family transcriptional regulator [Micromonospora sp. KC606]TDC83889.1 TetR/AcrR family transcriptional regulator [Micromonospora sp. KC606]